MYENDVQLEAMVAMPRVVEEFNKNNDKKLTWANSFPPSSNQSVYRPGSRGYDFMGLLDVQKVLVLEFKNRVLVAEKVKVSEIGDDQIIFLKSLGGGIETFVVFNLIEGVGGSDFSPGYGKSVNVLSNMLAIDPEKFSVEDGGASHFLNATVEETLYARFLKFLNKDTSKEVFAPLMEFLIRSKSVSQLNNLVLFCQSAVGFRVFSGVQISRLWSEILAKNGDDISVIEQNYNEITDAMKTIVSTKVKIKKLSDIRKNIEKGGAQSKGKANNDNIFKDLEDNLKSSEQRLIEAREKFAQHLLESVNVPEEGLSNKGVTLRG